MQFRLAFMGIDGQKLEMLFIAVEERGKCLGKKLLRYGIENFEFRGRLGALQEQRFTKKDWMLFRNKIGDWQEAYMDRLNKEYIELLSEDANPSEKFWRLDRRIKEDRKKTGVHLEMSRSNLVYNIISLISDSAISFEDLEEFSDELKETVKCLC
ncbi:hypothetical protein [Clostridium sp. KNHs205]|jgi:hypothetical protein|uniref:hypothetical protein n=1 Tax=Clostridium sp. KNHs205 TaxID=1449050 RepID=UPI000ABE2AA4